MEDDRAQVDLGIAADIEESQMAQAESSHYASTQPQDQHQPAVKQPKKRFVGRRAAAEASSKNGGEAAAGESGALQGLFTLGHMISDRST